MYRRGAKPIVTGRLFLMALVWLMQVLMMMTESIVATAGMIDLRDRAGMLLLMIMMMR